ncbi:efflux RND transporter periplasmic adaptor subunit [Planctomycetales bacterium ZRK34]|nr:efflux RND transporter periplasmic adaptor subunit [Planctomycetales bacterium ZRK34]
MKLHALIIALLPLSLLFFGGCEDNAHKPAAAHASDHKDHEDVDAHDHGDEHADAHDQEEEHADEVRLTPEAIERWDIRVEPLKRHVLTETLIAPARISFNNERIAHVGSVVSGRVSQIQVRIGDDVKADDVPMVIVSPELGQTQSQYLQNRSAIGTAEATVEVARSLYERAKALYDESQGIALSEVQKREAELRAAEGELVATRSAVTAAENALHVLGMDQQAIKQLAETQEINPNYVLRAPFAGRVVQREAKLGEAVGPDRDALLVIADLQTLWVIADVPEARLGEIGVGSKAHVSVPAYRGREFKGAVTYIGTQLNTATRTIPVRIEVPDPELLLRPGMFAQAQIEFINTADEPALAVPEVAVQNVEGDTCVFVPVADEPNTFAKRPVRIGQPIGRMAPLLDGLREGEHYVANGSFILKADLGKAGASHDH